MADTISGLLNNLDANNVLSPGLNRSSLVQLELRECLLDEDAR